MKARIIYTHFYQSERVLSTSANARWLFMYFLTCPYIGLTGAFKLAKSKIAFETALSAQEVQTALQELDTLGLVKQIDDWIIIPDTHEKNRFDIGAKTSVAFQKELNQLPEKIKDCLINLSVYPIDTLSVNADTPRNKNIEIRNKKPYKELDKSICISPNTGTTAKQIADDFEAYREGVV